MTATNTAATRGAESELRAAARRRGLTMKELAAKMGTTPSYLSQIATGNRPWSPAMREKAEAVLGEVPGQGIVYRQGGVVSGESSYIRERARELGMSMQDLAERVGVSYGYMVQASRGHRNMGVKVQKRVESALQAPAKVAPAMCPDVDRQAVWERMDAHGISQNEVARRVGVSSGHLSQIMNGSRSPSPGVLKRLHGGALPADAGGAGDARRGEGAGLAQGRAEGDGREGRRWAWARGGRRRYKDRWTRALGREGGLRVSHRVRRQGPGVGGACGRTGLLGHAEATGEGRGLVSVEWVLSLEHE